MTTLETAPEPAAGTEKDSIPDGSTAIDPDDVADPVVTILIAAIGLVAAGLVVGLIVVILRGNRARRRALATGPASNTDIDETDAP